MARQGLCILEGAAMEVCDAGQSRDKGSSPAVTGTTFQTGLLVQPEEPDRERVRADRWLVVPVSDKIVAGSLIAELYQHGTKLIIDGDLPCPATLGDMTTDVDNVAYLSICLCHVLPT